LSGSLRINIEEYLDRIGVKSKATRLMIAYAYASIVDCLDAGVNSQLLSKVVADLEEAREYGAFDDLLGVYMVALYSICKDDVYKGDILCGEIRKSEEMLKNGVQYSKSDLIWVAKDTRVLEKMWNRYREKLGVKKSFLARLKEKLGF